MDRKKHSKMSKKHPCDFNGTITVIIPMLPLCTNDLFEAKAKYCPFCGKKLPTQNAKKK